MLLSKLLGERYKEKPVESQTINHTFMLRGGYIRQVTSGVYSLLPIAKKVTNKIENIIREEMNRIDGQEVLLPVVMPRELWDESGRYDSVDNSLVRFKDRNKHDMVLGITHEEAAVALARNEVKTYAKYPFMIYQIQTKFRDEARPRGGLIRVREFTMKDAYSFHTSQEDLEQYYDRCLESYHTIYRRAGLKNVIAVKSDTGDMGGTGAHEFSYLSDIGEDTLVICESCGYQANVEACEVNSLPINTTNGTFSSGTFSKVHTPDIKTIDDLSAFFACEKSRFIKSAVFAVENSDECLVVFIRGDYEINEVKLKNITKAKIFPLTNYEDIDLCFGFIGPKDLNKKKITVIYDKTIADCSDMICGANETDYHFTGVVVARDLEITEFVDVAKINDGDVCPICKKSIRLSKGVEIGNIFQLGIKYTKAMNMTYTNASGTSEYPIMGCYGIGVGRLLACIIEEHHDDYGPIWPISVAPYEIHVCAFNSKNEQVKSKAHEVYNELKKKHDVILDDREVGTGIQLADADLIGAPIRIIISTRNLDNNQIEIVTRDKSVKKLVASDELYCAIDQMVQEMKSITK